LVRCSGVCACPATPAVVASYIAEAECDNPLEELFALEELHDRHGAANPVATRLVREVLEQRFLADEEIPPPRSWSRAERMCFGLLPPFLQRVVARRENDRDSALRKTK
jgi:hypothetical protein